MPDADVSWLSGGRPSRFRLRPLWRRWRRSEPVPAVEGENDAIAFYEELFASVRLKPIVVVVLVDEGWQDVAVWHDFFPQARIIAVRRAVPEPAPERFTTRLHVETGDHADPAFLEDLATRLAFSSAPAVIADHRARASRGHVACLRALYGQLAPGGIYLIADLSLGSDPEPYRFVEGVARRLLGEPARKTDDGAAETILAETDHVRVRDRGCVLKKHRRAIRRLRLADARDLSDPPARSFGRPSYRRGVPRIVGAPDWVAAIVAEHADEAVVPPESLVCTLRDAVVFRSGMIRCGEHLVRESLTNIPPGEQNESLRFHADGTAHVEIANPKTAGPEAAPLHVDETTVLLTQEWDENYGHWIVEGLPRIVQAGETVDLRRVRVVLNDHPGMRTVYLDSLAPFGIAPEQAIWLGRREVRFRELVYPTPVTVQPWVKSPLILKAAARLRTAMGDGDGPARLYVSRNRWGRRRLINEAEVEALLAERGYRTVHPETLSFRDQVALFAGAERVVGAMGAALANILFAPDGLRLLAMTNRDMIDDFFFDLTSLKGGGYHALHGTSDRPGLGMQSDFTICPTQLKQCLDDWDF
ncbi:hypothetical protein LNAOJCKE_3272 [Methylorubrum aminovorans]|uniref:Glycosyltransferase 61 catalytic domain-containing protein n=2 Tax=Methylorubrum aminovorans TaxID=269069 RepID=A0ABQ4UFJ6_9HYPH|nr:hypothetical protein LNAOJCKE_3272 [Methylorubrum aminovorans]